MLAPSVPTDPATIRRASTADLCSWATKADKHTLGLIREIAAKRSTEAARALVIFIDHQLGGPINLPPLSVPPPLPKPWYKRRAVYIASAVLGAVLMGVGHGAGEQIWHWVWPTLTEIVRL